jgi:tetratricopeptide (TPR) repeat protein
LRQLVDVQPDNIMAAELLTATLLQTNKFDEAKALATKIIEANKDNYAGYALRAKVTDQQANGLREEHQEAERKTLHESSIADYTAALEKVPQNPATNRLQFLIDRAEAYLSVDKTDEARADVKAALAIKPDDLQAILVRSFCSAREKKYGDAIEDMKMVLEMIDNSGGNSLGLHLQLGSYYVANKQPRKAVEIFTNLLSEEIENPELKSSTLRARADAYLAFGKHVEAIKDYEAALKIEPQDSGILNNLAWVLATSPDDKIRNGDRSIEYGLKACEVTDYKASHILSTLAAGYAEKGDFETAKKWSAKAVELGEGNENIEQLKQELESYKQGKPWREAQQTEENKDSTKSSDTDF